MATLVARIRRWGVPYEDKPGGAPALSEESARDKRSSSRGWWRRSGSVSRVITWLALGCEDARAMIRGSMRWR